MCMKPLHAVQAQQDTCMGLPEVESKELGSVPLLLEGRHALHGVGHYGHSPRAHLPTTPGIHQVGVPVYQNKSL